MINRDRIINDFIELVGIDSLSKNEKDIADVLKMKINNMGYDAGFDGTSLKMGGNADNLIFKVDGDKSIAPIVLMAHMDTVRPGNGKVAILDGEYIKSSGDTVLGGDDVAGICVILEAIRVLEGEKHGDIYVIFTVAEEIGLLGAKNVDYSRINARYGFVLDNSGKIGTVAVKAPSHISLDVEIIGKASHAGIEPENGINAICVAANAISRMQLGRIDSNTTANIGLINGGSATNIVCEKVNIKGEARSLDDDKLEEQVRHMKRCLEEACKKFGAKLIVREEKEYLSYDVSNDSGIIDVLRKAACASGIELVLESTGGGSDTNVLNAKGILACNVSVGMDRIHTVDERIKISDMLDSVKFLCNIIRSV